MGDIRTRRTGTVGFFNRYADNLRIDSKHFIFEEKSRQIFDELMNTKPGALIPIPRNLGISFIKTQHVLVINDPLMPQWRPYTHEEAEAFFKPER